MRFLEDQGEVGTQTAQLLRQEKSLRDGKTQQGSHEQLPTTEPPLLTKPQWLLQSKGGKEAASGRTLRRGRWESAHLSKPGKAGAPSASGTAHTFNA